MAAEPRRPAPTDVFRPRLPLDPFAPPDAQPAHDAHELPKMNPDTPWLAHDLAGLTHAFSQGPNVLLVLGAPSPHALAPILRSTTFTRSLILLVTHTPPTRSALVAAAGATNSTQAAIRVLRLSEPLAPGAPAFALALVAVLEAAASVARSWRAQVVAAPPLPGSGPDIGQLAQAANGAFSVIESLSDPGVPTPPLVNEHVHPTGTAGRRSNLVPTPANHSPYPAGRARPPSALSVDTTNSARSGFFFSSTASLTKKTSTSHLSTSPPSSNSKRLSTSSKRLSSSGTPAKTAVNDGTRAFDALISFLPAAQPEKAILKHVVLTSTLAGSFLSGPAFGFFASPNASATTSYSYFGSLPGSRRGSVSSGIGLNGSPSPSGSRAASIIGGTIKSTESAGGDTERPASPSRSFMSLFNHSPASAPPMQTSRSVPGSPRGSVYNDYASAYTSAYPPRVSAHIVHVLPASYRSGKLTGALGAFLGNFSPPTGPLSGGARAPMKPHAYVLAERAVSSVSSPGLASSSSLGALECILVGALEAEAPLQEDIKGKRREEGLRTGRWVAGVIVPSEEVEGGEESGSGSGDDEELESGANVKGKAPFGLPTPPASRSGSGEDENHSGSRSGHVSAPSGSGSGMLEPPPHSQPKFKRMSTGPGNANAAFPTTVQPTVTRSPSGRRRAESAPAPVLLSSLTKSPPPPLPLSSSQIPGAPGSGPSPRPQRQSKTWARGSKFFGGKTADDFRLVSPTKEGQKTVHKGRSSPDLRELQKRKTRRWWAFWS
ncbi:hypothetical protein MKEN_00585100 [Mycena kentingensis (nom. inval.)]|nr:hypothetical protein MKEN_00585100 [Mycena kentingensis (nom. inval.)]